MLGVAQSVYQKGGVGAFWAGYTPNLVRTFLVNAVELGTYDQAKQMVVPYTGDNAFGHCAAGGIAGALSAIVTTPADVIKVRLMDQTGNVGVAEMKVNGVSGAPISSGRAGIMSAPSKVAPRLQSVAGYASSVSSSSEPTGRYSGSIDAVVKTVRHEGVLALYKGFQANIVRKVGWLASFFLVYEQIRRNLSGAA